MFLIFEGSVFVHSILKFFHIVWDFQTWVTAQTLGLKQLYGHFVVKYESLTKCRKDPTRPLPHPLTFLNSRFFFIFQVVSQVPPPFYRHLTMIQILIELPKRYNIQYTQKSIYGHQKPLRFFSGPHYENYDFCVPAAILC